MTPALPHRIFRSRCLGLTALLITLAIGLGARAAISEGPKPINEYEAQKRRNVELFEANQSYQEQLRVGQERYRQMQTNRAKIIASMAAEFQARQQVVVLQPAAAPPAKPKEPIKGLKPILAAVLLGIGFFGFGYYLYIHREREPAAPSPKRPE